MSALQFRQIGHSLRLHRLRPWFCADRMDFDGKLVDDFTVPKNSILDRVRVQGVLTVFLKMRTFVEGVGG